MADGLIRWAPPVHGMHGGISDVNMPDGYCRLLYNMVPDGIGLYTRRPWVSVKNTGQINRPRWLYSYTINTANGLFYLTPANDSFRVLSGGASSSATMLASSGTVTESVGFHFNSVFIYTHYPAGGPRQYDGTTESALSITRPGSGDWNTLTDADVTGGHPFKSRVYYWSFKTNEILYTAVNAAGGTLTSFPLERVSQSGGNVKLITSLTMDGGNGPDDLLVIVLDTGETLIYQGSDPSSSNDWSIIGRFTIPPPLNADSVCKMGGDALLLTAQGLVPVQQFVKATFGRIQVDWITAINPMIVACIQRFNNAGSAVPTGRPYYSALAGMLFVTISNGGESVDDAQCFAMNVATGGWWINRFGLDDGMQTAEDYENAVTIPYPNNATNGYGTRSGCFMSFCDYPATGTTYTGLFQQDTTPISGTFIASYGVNGLPLVYDDLDGLGEEMPIAQEILHDWKTGGPAMATAEARVLMRVFDNEASLTYASPTLTIYRDYRPDRSATATLPTSEPYQQTVPIGIEGHALSARVTFSSKGGTRFSPSGFLYQGTVASAIPGKL